MGAGPRRQPGSTSTGPQDAAILHTPERVTAHLDGLRVERAESVDRPVEGAPRPAVDILVVAVKPED